MDGTKSARMIGEYYCKKLAGKNPDHAGATPFPGTAQPIRTTHRRLGISVPEIEANVSTANLLASIVNQCDPGHDPVISTYVSDIERAAEQSSATTQKFISEKVATTVCMCDPIAPAFGTKPYTAARYFPEILMAGTGLIDYDKLGRLYSPEQMPHAFGPSHLRDETPFHDSDASIVWRTSGNSGEPCRACNLTWAYYAMAAALLQGTGPVLYPLNMEKAALSSEPNGGWEASGGNRHVIMTKVSSTTCPDHVGLPSHRRPRGPVLRHRRVVRRVGRAPAHCGQRGPGRGGRGQRHRLLRARRVHGCRDSPPPRTRSGPASPRLAGRIEPGAPAAGLAPPLLVLWRVSRDSPG